MKQKKNAANRNVIKWIISNSKSILPSMILITVLSVALACFGVMLAFVSKGVIDVATHQAPGTLKSKITTLIFVILAQIALQALYSNFNVRASGKLLIRLKNHVFSTVMKKDWQSVSAYHSGDLLNRINNDANVIMQSVIGIVPSFLSLVTKIIVGFGYLFALDSTFSLIVLIVGPTVLVCARAYSKKMKFYHKKCQEADGKTSSFMQETIQNLLMIKSFNSENYMDNCATDLQSVAYKLKIRRNTISIFANIGLFLIFYASYYMALAWGAFRLASGQITYGTMTAFLQLINQVQSPFMNLSSLLPQYYAMIASAERLMELEALPDEQTLNDESQLKTISDNFKSVNINGISFSYDNEEVFKDASFSINRGEFIAIAGTSGVGKSTLMKLVLGIIKPQSGSITIKTDSCEYTADKTVRRMFSYVPQGNMILSGTIRDNIRFANGHADDETVISCAKNAEIWDFISSLPEGLDTPLGERGLGLSEGQIQRIAIARALLYDTPVLLLDEATSALDEKTEAAVLKNLKNMQTKTCIIISHKPAALEICDKILTVCAKKLVFAENI